jgi:hypothetical protein
MTHPASQATRHKRIQYWDDERSLGNSLIVTLHLGWQFSDDPGNAEHVRGFDTVRDAMREVRSSIPCDCPDCTAKATQS